MDSQAPLPDDGSRESALLIQREDMKHRALLTAALMMTSAGVAAADLLAVRVVAPASVLHGGNPSALTPQHAIAAGDVVSAGSRGKVALQLAGGGLLTLSSLGDVQVYEARGPRGKAPALAKLQLLAGALRVDSRAANSKPAQDVRLNVGSLKTRIFGADAWAANTAEGDTLCLLAGSASVQTGSTTEARLDSPGSCLRREPDGQLSRFAIESDAVIVGAINATAFDGMSGPLPIPETVAVAAAAATPAPTPLPDAARPAAGSVPAPDAASGGWTVVVLSLSRPEPVATRVQVLAEQGLPASTRSATVNGVTMHRAVVGRFASQAEARAYATGTLAASGIKGWASPL